MLEYWNSGILPILPSFHYSISPFRNNAPLRFLRGFPSPRFTVGCSLRQVSGIKLDRMLFVCIDAPHSLPTGPGPDRGRGRQAHLATSRSN